MRVNKINKKHVYISLPISGHDLNERLGYATIIKELAIEYFGTKDWRIMCPFDISPYRDENEYKDYMRDDLYVLYGSDAIVLCENWLNSKGCRDEFFIAVNQQIEIYVVSKDENENKIIIPLDIDVIQHLMSKAAELALEQQNILLKSNEKKIV